MAHYYGSTTGNRSERTAPGTKDSVIRGWVQTWTVRLSVGMGRMRDDEGDEAFIEIGRGPSGDGGTLRITIDNTDIFSKALKSGDKRVEREVAKIQASFHKLNEIAADAVERAKKEQERQRRKDERARKAEERRRAELFDSLTAEEKQRLGDISSINMNPSVNSEDDILMAMRDRFPTMERDDRGRIIVQAKPQGAYSTYSFDATEGQWIMPFEPADLGIEDTIRETGYGWRLEEGVPA